MPLTVNITSSCAISNLLHLLPRQQINKHNNLIILISIHIVIVVVADTEL